MIVLLTDLVDSRKIENRQEFDKRLDRVIEQINGMYKLYAPLTRTKGIDEMSAVFENAHEIPHACLTLQILLPEVAIRFSASDGEIDIESDSRSANKLDGPAFHNAESYLNLLEKRKDHFSLSKKGNNIQVSGLINNLMEFCLHSVRHWPKQSAIATAHAWTTFPPVSQIMMAHDLNMSPQAISSALERTNYQLIKKSIKDLSALLAIR